MNVGFTFTDESLGFAKTSRGGRVSLNPPPGGIILAQDPIISQVAISGNKPKQSPPVMAEKIFFMWRKGNPKYFYQLFIRHAKIRVYCLLEQKPLFT
jgi:hypothetical protein